MFTFKNLQHFFAKTAQAIVAAAKKLPGALEKVEETRAVVEGVTQVVDPAAVVLEDAAYSLLGAVLAAIHAGGDAVKAKLADAGLDVVAIQKAEAAYASVPQVVAVASAIKQ